MAANLYVQIGTNFEKKLTYGRNLKRHLRVGVQAPVLGERSRSHVVSTGAHRYKGSLCSVKSLRPLIWFVWSPKRSFTVFNSCMMSAKSLFPDDSILHKPGKLNAEEWAELCIKAC